MLGGERYTHRVVKDVNYEGRGRSRRRDLFTGASLHRSLIIPVLHDSAVHSTALHCNALLHPQCTALHCTNRSTLHCSVSLCTALKSGLPLRQCLYNLCPGLHTRCWQGGRCNYDYPSRGRGFRVCAPPVWGRTGGQETRVETLASAVGPPP